MAAGCASNSKKSHTGREHEGIEGSLWIVKKLLNEMMENKFFERSDSLCIDPQMT